MLRVCVLRYDLSQASGGVFFALWGGCVILAKSRHSELSKKLPHQSNLGGNS